MAWLADFAAPVSGLAGIAVGWLFSDRSGSRRGPSQSAQWMYADGAHVARGWGACPEHKGQLVRALLDGKGA